MRIRARLRAVLPVLFLAPLLIVVAPEARAAPGDLDPTFGAGGRVLGPPNVINAVAIDSKGRVVVAGRDPAPLTTSHFLVARYMPDGSPDRTFDGDGVVTTDIGGGSHDEAFAVTIVNDEVVNDEILVAGQVGDSPNVNSDFVVVRYKENGTLDDAFDSDGQAVVPDTGANSVAYAIAVREKNEGADEIVLAGKSAGDIALARLNVQTGALIGMMTSKIPGDDEALAMALTEDGVVVSGNAFSQELSQTSHVILARFTEDGNSFAPDPGFGTSTGYTLGPPGNAAALVKQVTKDGTRLVTAGATTGATTGAVTGVAGVADPIAEQPEQEEAHPSRFLLARFTADGVPEATFGVGGVVMTSFGTDAAFARALAVDEVGRLVAVGGAGGDFALARYTPDGVLDTSFGDEGRVTTDFGNKDVDIEYARALVIQSGNGKLVAGGAGGLTSTGSFSGVTAVARYDVHDDLSANGVVRLSAAPDPVVVGGRLTYSTMVENASVEGPLYGVKVIFDLPQGVVLESLRPSQGVCAGESGPQIRCDLGSLRPGAQAGVSLDFLPLAPQGTRTLTVRASARNDARLEDNAASASVTVVDAPGEWVAARPLGTGRFNHTATVLEDGRVLVAGGVSPGGPDVVPSGQDPTASAEVFDPATGSWSSAGTMKKPRAGHTATLLSDGRVLVAGGDTDDEDFTASSEIFDPSLPMAQAWSEAASLETGRVHAAAERLLNGDVLVVAGAGQHADVQHADGRIDPHPCRAEPEEGAEPPEEGAEPPEEGNQRFLRSAEVYRVSSDRWERAGCLSHGRANLYPAHYSLDGKHTATLMPSGKVLVVGGFRGLAFEDPPGQERMAAPELYDPDPDPGEDFWSAAPEQAVRRLGHIAVARPDGSVLIAGGSQTNGDPASTPSVERYVPAVGPDGAWEPAASMLRGRISHAAARLSDGRVLVAGGHMEALRVVRATEVFGEAGERWTSAGLMETPRVVHTANALRTGPLSACGSACGAVLVAGGRDDQGDGGGGLASAELYYPRPRVTALAPPTGPASGGTTVVITGSGLASTESVHFGGVPAAGFAVDPENPDGKLTAVAPAHAKGLADVKVTTRGGTSSAVEAARFAFVGLPGQVTDLAATAVSEDAVRLSFSATDDGSGVRPASRYIVKQSTGPIVDQASFDAADSVCTGACTFRGLNLVGDPAGLTLRGVEPGFTYRYALQALDSSGKRGPISNVASIRLGDERTAGTTGRSATIDGYRLVASDGGVFALGGARFLGSTGAIRLNQPIVGTAGTPSGNGYWLVASDGGVFAFGDARFSGSTGAIRLNQPIVGMAATPSGNGYWLVGADGGVFAFGDARFLGSTGAMRLNKPVVGIAATPSGRGYWLAASDGGVFAFGDARFLGSTGAIRLNRPVVGVTASPTGNGYRLVASDGGIFAFGGARFLGSTGAIRLNQPIVAMAATASGNGYRLVASDGGVFAFGDAPFLGSLGGMRLNRPVVGVS